MADDTRYAYAVARIRGMETRLLDRQWIERLLSESAEGALKALSDSAYQEAVEDVRRPEDIEAGLTKALAETFNVVSGVAPDPGLIDLFRIRWDFRNAKSLLKASLLKLDGDEIGVARGVGTLDADVLASAVADRSFTVLPAFLADALRDAEDAYGDRGEIGVVDEVLDRAMWAYTIEVARASGEEFLVRFFEAEIDLANVKAFIRIKDAGLDRGDLSRAFLPGGTLDAGFFGGLLGEPTDAFARRLEYGRFAALAEVFRDWSPGKTPLLELACDNALLAEAEGSKTIAYGIEPLVAYILSRRIEIKLIRAAMTAKLDDLGRAAVEARMRNIHV